MESDLACDASEDGGEDVARRGTALRVVEVGRDLGAEPSHEPPSHVPLGAEAVRDPIRRHPRRCGQTTLGDLGRRAELAGPTQ